MPADQKTTLFSAAICKATQAPLCTKYGEVHGLGCQVCAQAKRRASGHQVLGLTRSEQGAQALAAAGAEAFYGDIEDHDSLRRGASLADGVIHTAFNHDFSTFMANCEKDAQAIQAIGSVLEGTPRPLLITSGVGMGASGHNTLAYEDRFD
ncbi:NAD(P)H-binding protein [Enterobacteriaceae bacterium H18W14]|nr:NAD(P)H-binding protein [Dryocola boscaweniae]MCT4717046.1 NAD(P)H-binding protein [Dryocola boscaweniae]